MNEQQCPLDIFNLRPYAVVLETQAVPELIKQLGWPGSFAGEFVTHSSIKSNS